jgi:hypothetical protein
MSAPDLTTRDPRRQALHQASLLRACMATSFIVYVAFGAVITLSTWSIAERAGGVGAVFGAMLFFYLPSIVAPWFIGFLVDKNMRSPWLSAVGLGLVVAAAMILLGQGASHAFICALLVVTSYVRELSNILVRKRLATHFRASAAVTLNGWETTVRRLGYLAGTLAGGALLAVASRERGGLVLLGLLIATWALLHRVERSHGAERRGGRLRSSFSRVRGHLAGTRVPAWIAVIVVHTLVAELLTASLAAFVLDRISDTPLAMSAISNAYILGALFGGVFLGRATSASRVVATLGASMGALGIAIYGFSLASSVAGAATGYFFVGLLFQGRTLCQALIQTEFDREHQAKLQSFVSILAGATTMASLALLSGLPRVVTPVLVHQAMAGVLALLCVGCLVLVSSTRARERRSARTWEHPHDLVGQSQPVPR